MGEKCYFYHISVEKCDIKVQFCRLITVITPLLGLHQSPISTPQPCPAESPWLPFLWPSERKATPPHATLLSSSSTWPTAHNSTQPPPLLAAARVPSPLSRSVPEPGDSFTAIPTTSRNHRLALRPPAIISGEPRSTHNSWCAFLLFFSFCM